MLSGCATHVLTNLHTLLSGTVCDKIMQLLMHQLLPIEIIVKSILKVAARLFLDMRDAT